MKDRLTDLREAAEMMGHVRKSRVRQITREGCVSNFSGTDDYLVRAINDLWHLVCDVAARRIQDDLRAEAERMRREADKVLE